MPVTELATNFSKIAGASTKELYSMAGIVFLADFFGWTNLQTVENFQFRIDVKYALNADPGYDFSLRSLERYQDGPAKYRSLESRQFNSGRIGCQFLAPSVPNRHRCGI